MLSNMMINIVLIVMCAYMITLRIRLANLRMDLKILNEFVFRTIRNISETEANLYKRTEYIHERIDDYERRIKKKI